MNNLSIFMRRAVTAVWSPTPQLKSYCSRSSPLSGQPCNKLYVGGFSWSVNEGDLLKAFSSFGEVTEIKILYNKDNGRSRGFGYVTFSNDDAAKSAKEAMHGKVAFGRLMKVDFDLGMVRGVPIKVPHIQETEVASTHNNCDQKD